MQHFDFQDWVDYVRGVAPADRAAAMRAALAAGAPDAVRSHALAAALREGVRWSGSVEVPAAVVRRAEALFATARPSAAPSLGVRLATLVLDSLATPQRAGARAAAGAVRHTTHRAGDLEIALRFERQPGSERVSIVGQMTSAGEADAARAAFPVTALRRDRMVARTLSTDRGEFQLDLPAGGASSLLLGLAEPEQQIEIDLEALDKRAPKRKTARGEGSAKRTEEPRE